MSIIRRPLSSSILGFDRFLEEIDRALSTDKVSNAFPPHNIFKISDGYIIEMALAGFKKSDIEIQFDKKKSTLQISGASTKSTPETAEMVYQGIASRQFSKAFTIAENLFVDSASMEDGILTVRLKLLVQPDNLPIQIDIS